MKRSAATEKETDCYRNQRPGTSQFRVLKLYSSEACYFFALGLSNAGLKA